MKGFIVNKALLAVIIILVLILATVSVGGDTASLGESVGVSDSVALQLIPGG